MIDKKILKKSLDKKKLWNDIINYKNLIGKVIVIYNKKINLVFDFNLLFIFLFINILTE